MLLEGLPLIAMDLGRIARMAIFGTLFKGPTVSAFYRILEARLPGRSKSAIAKKIAIDLGPWSALQNWSFLFLISLMEGKGVVGSLGRANGEIWGLQASAYRIWPVAHLLNYIAVPPALRVLYVNSVGLLWTIVLCVAGKAEAPAPHNCRNLLEDEPTALAGNDESMEGLLNMVRHGMAPFARSSAVPIYATAA